jgi:hypothetical protein
MARDRFALVVGLNYYEKARPLFGCVSDARAVASCLRQNDDSEGTDNFFVEEMCAEDRTSAVSTRHLRERIRAAFETKVNTQIFYYAGHGDLDSAGGYLIASDWTVGDAGISLNDILSWATQSEADNRVIILDSCRSGALGMRPTQRGVSEIAEGMTILAASTEDQYASEANGHGVFTELLVDALSGAAANLLGEITPGSVYAHIDQSLPPNAQRPVFKTNVHSFVSLRKVRAPVPLADLRRITDLFRSGNTHALNPTYEKERGVESLPENLPPPDPVNSDKFAVLQKYNRVGLVVPVDAPHMWHAAMYSKSCKLTLLGEHYLRLRNKGLI